MESRENDTEKKKSKNTGCFILVFLICALGIYPALDDESNVRMFGLFPIVALGLVIAYFTAKGITGGDE
jgi:nitrate reductase NapE component